MFRNTMLDDLARDTLFSRDELRKMHQHFRDRSLTGEVTLRDFTQVVAVIFDKAEEQVKEYSSAYGAAPCAFPLLGPQSCLLLLAVGCVCDTGPDHYFETRCILFSTACFTALSAGMPSGVTLYSPPAITCVGAVLNFVSPRTRFQAVRHGQ